MSDDKRDYMCIDVKGKRKHERALLSLFRGGDSQKIGKNGQGIRSTDG